MHYIGQFDPTQITPNNGIAKNGYIGVNIADAGQKVLFTNLAPVNIQLNFEDGTTAILHAGQANYWVVQNPTPVIEWSQQLVLNISGSAVNMCTVVVYDRDEPVVGTYPISLVYFTIIGNQNGVNTQVSSITNDGSTLGTSIVEVTPAGQSVSGITLSNEGVLLVDVLITGVYHQAIKTQKSGAVIQLGNALDTTEVLGQLLVDKAVTVTGVSSFNNNISVSGTSTLSGATSIGSNLTVSGTISTANGNYYGADPSNTILSTSGLSGSGKTRLQNTDVVSIQVPVGTDMFHVNSSGVFVDSALDLQGNNILHTNTISDSGGTNWAAVTAGSVTRIASPGTVALQVPGGTTVLSVDSGGVHCSNTLNLVNGSFTRVAHGTATLTPGGVTITHGLGATPDIVLLSCLAGPSTSTNAVSGLGATTFIGYSNSSLSYTWIAIKF